ncbi:MAG: reverse transcriptase family protein [Terracidiphilus sp.]
MKTSPNPKRFSISSPEELAALLSTKVAHIEWVLSHLGNLYHRKDRPKPNGKKRTLWIPHGALRPLQDQIQKEILSGSNFTDCAHGGVPKRSIITNAKHHVGKRILSTMDIANCFPSISPERVRRVFEELGFSGHALSILTVLTTWDFQLPQGPPTSPAIANLALAKLDRRQLGVAKQHGFTYTRFVDDLSASGGGRLRKVRNLQERIVKSEGFSIKPLKDGQKKLMYREHDRQETTGLVVNRKVNLPREKRKGIIGDTKAALRGKGEVNDSEKGKILWLASVNPDAGAAVVKAVRQQRRQP